MNKSSRMQLISMVVLIIIFLASFGDLSAQSNNWPQFRGHNASGLADNSSKPPVQFGENQNLLWKIPLPEGHSSPVIWDNNIFLTGYIKDKKELRTICIDRNTGHVKWQQSIFPEDIENFHTIGNAAVATVTTDGKNVYAYFGSYGLLCYDINGTLIWEMPIPIVETWFGASTSPIETKDLLILNHDLDKNSYLLAINKSTGERIWKVLLPDVSNSPEKSSYATPVVMNDQVILHRKWEISAYSLTDGSRLWWLTTPTSGVSTPIFHQNTLYIGSWQEMGEKEQVGELPDFETMLIQYDNASDGFISKEEIPDSLVIFSRPEMTDFGYGSALKVVHLYEEFDKNEDGLIDKEEWEESVETFSLFYGESGLMALSPTGKGELPYSQVLWKIRDKVPEVPSPIYYEGCVYMIKNGGIITCVDAESGKINYRERLGASGPYFASPIVAGGNLYIPSGKGVITVIKAGKSLDVLARNKLKERVLATPAVVENTLYVRTTQHLYAFGQ